MLQLYQVSALLLVTEGLFFSVSSDSWSNDTCKPYEDDEMGFFKVHTTLLRVPGLDLLMQHAGL